MRVNSGSKRCLFTFDAQRYLLADVVEDWGNGVPIQKFKLEWIEPIKILQSYITCEGKFDLFFKYHFRSFNISIMNPKGISHSSS